jgi:hypothetical protein
MKKIEIIYEKLKGKESSKELVPIGFDGTVFDYLKYDLIYHPISHYIFYSIKNDEYGIFLELEKYITENRVSIFNDLGVLNLKNYLMENEYEKLFLKGYEWENDELFIQIKEMTA